MPDATSPQPSPPAPVVAPRVPLPGTQVRRCEPFPWVQGPYVVVDNLLFHLRYEQTVVGDGYPARKVGYRTEATGKDVRNWLRGSMRFWLSSEASVTDDGTIYYRQTRNHAAVRLIPDPASDLLVTVPDQQLTADAYRVTGNDRPPQLWTPATLRAVIAYVTAPGVVDWPDGWAHIARDGTVTFARGGDPWSTPPRYTAEPTDAPAGWGPQCATCRRHLSEHDPDRGAFGTPCDEFRTEPQPQ
ncbi:hypothetical protein ACFV3E_40760 [Streptomyces sp. NPDC059718]